MYQQMWNAELLQICLMHMVPQIILRILSICRKDNYTEYNRLYVPDFSAHFTVHFAHQLNKTQYTVHFCKIFQVVYIWVYVHILLSTDVSPSTCQHIHCTVSAFSISILKLNWDISTISSCHACVLKTSDHAVTYEFCVNNHLTHNSWLCANTMLIDS